jgi:hypothetical protein
MCADASGGAPDHEPLAFKSLSVWQEAERQRRIAERRHIALTDAMTALLTDAIKAERGAA